MVTREILHGGAIRRPIRWRRDVAGGPDRLAWYDIAPGEQCTAHWHTGKAEAWLVVAGRGRVEIGAEVFEAETGDAFVTEPGLAHAIWNTGDTTFTFVNIVRWTGGPVTTVEVDR